MVRTFSVQRTADYDGDYPYTPEELASAKYVVGVNNGDWHLVQTVKDVLDLIGGELFLAGMDDEAESEDEHGA